eukprot:Seg1281.2 transcript_id=Seg1281.2/GoldUCD/mRNA.D3Y31 product="Protein phosphatase 1 regulatory subunit 27" protein_id=Seg1281.2/GoldUCD/D3Y31
MFVRDSVYDLLVDFMKQDDAAGLKFFLQQERDRRCYLSHRNNDGLMLLHQACLLGKLSVAKTLVECGGDIEGRSSVGWTALHASALSGCYELVSYLINTCASNVIARDDMGCKPIDLTLDSQITDLIKSKTDEKEARDAEEAKIFKELALLDFKVRANEKQRSYTAPTPITKQSRNVDVPRNKGYTIIPVRVSYAVNDDSLAETRSLPGDFANYSPRICRHRKTGTDPDIAKRDSGIYEDFIDARASPIGSKKTEKGRAFLEVNRCRSSFV